MDRKIYILGTSHEYQRNDDGCSQSSIVKFKNYLREICERYEVKAIAEEMSEEALAFFDREISIPKQFTQEINIHHQYVDPTDEEKKKICIKPSGYFAQGVKFIENLRPKEVRGRSQEEADQLEWEEDLKREPVWLEKILALNMWPLLFICGSKHVESFKYLSVKQCISVQVVNKNWKPID